MTEKLLTDVEYNYKIIEENIAIAAEQSGRSREDITFLAATKTVSAPVINHAISLGLRYIGENKVQELLQKYDEYDLDNASLQFIGHLQTNKVRQIIDKVDLIQSVDSLKLAKEISKQAQKNRKDCKYSDRSEHWRRGIKVGSCTGVIGRFALSGIRN